MLDTCVIWCDGYGTQDQCVPSGVLSDVQYGMQDLVCIGNARYDVLDLCAIWCAIWNAIWNVGSDVLSGVLCGTIDQT